MIFWVLIFLEAVSMKKSTFYDLLFYERYSFERYVFHHWTWLNVFMMWKYTPYISVTHKVLKSCRSKMATLAHDVCDVHGASLLYIKTYWQGLYRVCPTGRMGESPTNKKFTHSPPPYQICIPSHRKLIQPNEKNKNILFSCSHCSCTIFVLISYSF